MAIVHLLTVRGRVEAELIQNRLENAGIENFLTNEHFSTMMPHYYGMLGSGIQIMIEDDKLVIAKETLADYFKPTIDELTTCPECGSTKIGYGFGRSKVSKILIVLISVLISNPFGNIQNDRYCKDCRHEF